MLLGRGALNDALVALAQLGAGFQDALYLLEVYFQDVVACLAAERTRLAVGWRQLNASAKEAQCRHEAICAEVQRGAIEAKAARASALVEKEALAKHCEETEASLKALKERVMET
ncbi:hypothetical protein D1007_30505 [Hordeum vulgare]|nr:hypothetical protein D1007_30505 [Hordeum vulgare]